MRSSRLPAVKRLADFDFTFQPSLRREQIDSLHELDFLRRKENVVFLGPPGVGKTHLAISLAIRAAERGRRVYYGSLRDLVGSLQEAETKGQLRRRSGSSPTIRAADETATCRYGATLFPSTSVPASTVLTEQGVRGVGDDPRGRGDGGGAASAAPPLPHREHQLPDAAAGDLAQALRQVPATPRTRASYPSGGAPGSGTRVGRGSPVAPLPPSAPDAPIPDPPPPIRPQPRQHPVNPSSAGTQPTPKKWDIFEAQKWDPAH